MAGEVKKEKTRQSCIANGGTWDAAGNGGLGQCIFPESETGSNTPKESVETSRGTFLGLNKTDIQLLKQQQAGDAPIPQAPTTQAPTRETPEGQVNPLGTAANVARTEATNVAREEYIGGQIDPLAQQLEQDIFNAPGTQPGAIGAGFGEDVENFGATQGVVAANTIKKGFEKLFGLEEGALGRTTQEEFLETTIPSTDIAPGKFLAKSLTAAEAAALAVAGTAAIPAILATSIGTSIITRVAGTSTALRAAVLAIVGTSLIGGGTSAVTDIRGKNINNLLSSISKASSDASSIQSAVQNGMDIDLAIQQLDILEQTVTDAEAEIKQLAIYNVDFRTSDEHIVIDAEIKQVRQNLLERTLAVRNVALTGRTAVDPAGLIYDMTKLQVEQNG